MKNPLKVLKSSHTIHFKSKVCSKTADIGRRIASRAALARIMRFVDEWSRKHKIEWIYIRRFPLSLLAMSFLERLSNHARIAWEYPTFPWISESRQTQGFARTFREQLLAAKMRRQVDLIVGISSVNCPREEKVLITTNGIDIETIPLKKKITFDVRIELLGLGKITKYHGYDRILEGMAGYKGDMDIIFNIAGDGKELKHLEKLASYHGISNQVRLWGVIDGKTLDDLFDRCHLGIGALSLDRMHNYGASPLKHREFCARGLPFIHCSGDPDFIGLEPFVRRIDCGDEPVKMDDIVRMVSKIYRGSADCRLILREHAVRNLDWKEKLKSISAYTMCEENLNLRRIDGILSTEE